MNEVSTTSISPGLTSPATIMLGTRLSGSRDAEPSIGLLWDAYAGFNTHAGASLGVVNELRYGKCETAYAVGATSSSVAAPKNVTRSEEQLSLETASDGWMTGVESRFNEPGSSSFLDETPSYPRELSESLACACGEQRRRSPLDSPGCSSKDSGCPTALFPVKSACLIAKAASSKLFLASDVTPACAPLASTAAKL
ncbi:hypothetical protein MTO96_020716 [Rhipicephalus appendiculatus]